MTSLTPPSAANRAQPAPNAEGQSRVLPGSWEGVLNRAREHAQNGNAEAIPLFEKVINGLSKLPLERRMAQQNRLQDFYLAGIIGLQSFYARRDRYADAMAVIRSAIPNAEGDDKLYLEQHHIGLQFMAEENDAALAALRTHMEADAEEVTDWSPLIWGYIRCFRAHEAATLLDELAVRYNVAPASADDSTAVTETTAVAESATEEDTNLATNAAAIDALRGIILLETGQTEAGIEAFQRSVENPASPYHNSRHLLYSRLANMGRYEDALQHIQQDSGQPVRAGFWKGLVFHRQGRFEDAKAAWRVIAEMDQETVNRAPTEATLAQFYLGDPDGEILSGLLAAIREAEHMHWTLFMLAAVGFAARGDRETAINDFRLAIGLLKSLSEGRKLPVSLWHMVRDLFKPEDIDVYAQFFEMPQPPNNRAQPAAA